MLLNYKSSHCAVRFVFAAIFVIGGSRFMYVVYVCWCPMRFLYQMMFVSLTVTRRVSHVEQKLLSRLEHMC